MTIYVNTFCSPEVYQCLFSFFRFGFVFTFYFLFLFLQSCSTCDCSKCYRLIIFIYFEKEGVFVVVIVAGGSVGRMMNKPNHSTTNWSTWLIY